MTKHLIINCDDFGQSKAANEAIMHLLEEGKASSATIMPPAPAFEEAATWVRVNRMTNIGLHLTFTSEIAGYRWPSLTGLTSLHDEHGHMHSTSRDFELKANPRHVRAEMKAQFQAMKRAGLSLSHVDNHMGSLYGIETGRSYVPYVLWQCSKRKLPFRLPRKIYEKDKFLTSIPNAGDILAKVGALADMLAVGLPDYLLSHPYAVEEGETYYSFKQMFIAKIYDLPDGVSETYIHPAVEDEQMRAFVPSWDKRVWEYKLMQDDDLTYAYRDSGVHLIDYRHAKSYLRRPRWKSMGVLIRR